MTTKVYDYAEKNRRRKAGKSVGTEKERAYAKGLRKKVNGMFGRETEAFQRDSLLGTLGEVSVKAQKSPKKDK